MGNISLRLTYLSVAGNIIPAIAKNIMKKRKVFYMKSIGVIRKVDELGRIVLPVEFRRTLNIKNNDSLEIFAQNNSIYITKLNPSCVLCGKTTKLTEIGDKYVCRNCLKNLSSLSGEQKTIPFPDEIVDNMLDNYTDIIEESFVEDHAIAQ